MTAEAEAHSAAVLECVALGPRVLAASCVLLASAAEAEPLQGLEAAYAGTVVSTYPDGRTAKLWLEPNGRYRGQGRRGGLSTGTWTLKGERICFRQSRPVPVPISYCTEIVDGGVGTVWSAKAVTGETVRMQLIAGR